ncbi:hypothetical protein CQ13_29725 [Bradyrhizobium retamae]|uniref:Uncharacterized protein n=1 Tax=Bradyrhizobium retamae TaxID=1300035 RepID=A0A0R3MX35_9BRAD|nr:hypothetical protein CQ13_29725 [Bradyrhizobium retamae]
MIEPTMQRLKYIVQHPQVPLEFDNARCLQRWCWFDAIFMGPATWFGIARIQKDSAAETMPTRNYGPRTTSCLIAKSTCSTAIGASSGKLVRMTRRYVGPW